MTQSYDIITARGALLTPPHRASHPAGQPWDECADSSPLSFVPIAIVVIGFRLHDEPPVPHFCLLFCFHSVLLALTHCL